MPSMERLPEDPEERRRFIKTWARQQQAHIEPTVPAPTKERRSRPLAWLDRYVARGLDRNLDTSGLIELPEHEHPDFNPYVPVEWHVAPRALWAVRASRDDTFVDFGAGKGRVLHQAAKWPLRRVIGVEVSAELAEQAQVIVDAHRGRYRCRHVEVVVADATEYQVPDDMTIGFFFDPFRGETMDAVLQRIIESIDRRPRRVRLIYVQPHDSEQFLATGRLRLVRQLRGGLGDKHFSRAAIFESV